jgi:protein ImuA
VEEISDEATMLPHEKAHIVSQLQSQILRLEGHRPLSQTTSSTHLGPIADAFNERSFPTGAVHEFLTARGHEHSAATTGFISALLPALMNGAGTCLWIGSTKRLFPAALKTFALNPEHFIFIKATKDKDILWAMEEALKCPAVNVVIGELKELDFTASRRLQLAVEKSHVTGFVIRRNYKTLGTTGCVSRWQISSLPSQPIENLSGVGLPRWKVELLKNRLGKQGVWDVYWKKGTFIPALQAEVLRTAPEIKQVG